ncbi:MAG TPA: hypothetical protein VFI29_13470 [Hanamia sp.]|nr:hypothetical protein [Hanamia sp.]
MNSERNIDWFKKSISPFLKDFEIKYKFFEKGDFGSVNRASFNNDEKGGYVDFWTSGWVNVYLVDYLEGNEILNALIEPNESQKIDEVLENLQKILSNS